MTNSGLIVQRRALAYITLISGNLEALREFLSRYGDNLPFSSKFILHLVHECKYLEGELDIHGRELIRNLSIPDTTLEVDDDKSRF